MDKTRSTPRPQFFVLRLWLAEGGDGCIQFGLPAASDEDEGAFLCELTGSCEPDTTVAAGDDGDLA